MSRDDEDDGHWFYIANSTGEVLRSPSMPQIRGMLMSLDRDEGLGEVWMTYVATGESLTWRNDGELQFRVPATTLRTLNDVSLEHARDVFILFDGFRQRELAALPWHAGVQLPADTKARAERTAATLAALVAAEDRKFIADLGPERPDEPCRHQGCVRGAVAHSVLCPAHHFESVIKRPYPFD